MTAAGVTYLVSRVAEDPRRHAAQVRRVRKLRPGAEIADGVAVFASQADWRARWGQVLSRVGEVIVLPGQGRMIGAAGAVEILDALAAGLPVGVLVGGECYPLVSLRVEPARFSLADAAEVYAEVPGRSRGGRRA